jgi:flagella basal body P-ring formation protein FlgA
MRLIVNTMLILAAALLCGSAVAAEITLNATAEAKYQFVTLGDLATVSGANDEETAKVADIFCGPAPAPGETREITLDYIKMRLRQCGLDPKSFKFSGAEAVNLRTVITVELPLSENCAGDEETDNVASASEPASAQAAALEDKIKAAIIDCVARKLAVRAGDVVVALDKVGAALADCDAAAEVLGVKPTRELKALGGISFSVTVQSGEREIRAIVSADVSLNMDVVVAARDISAGDVLDEAAVSVQHISISANPADYFTSVSSLDGFKATKTVAAGQAVTAAAVEQPVLVKRNDVVKVFVRVAGSDIVVETTARADKEGRKGEFINVTNTISKQTFSAQIIGQGQVQVTVGE